MEESRFSALMKMNVHNLMEEYVSERVIDIYDILKKEQPSWLTCTCESCILDSISYVLNRITPHYIVSGRGAIYTSQALEDNQLRADVDALAMEAIRIINSVQRPYHKLSSKINDMIKTLDNVPTFNFPVISGTVFDGNTFEPIIDAEICLKNRDGIVVMHDFSWSNPCKTYKSTKGSFSFWPESSSSSNENEIKKFCFTITAKANGYQEASQGFEIVLSSELKKRIFINQSITMKLPDFILFNS